MRVSPGNLADEIEKELRSYSEEVTEKMKKAARAACRTAIKEVRANAPKKTGAYAKGWTSKVIKQTDESIQIVVYNKNHYQRTHLLEKPHAIKNRTRRVYGQTKAHPHIKPAEEKAVRQYERDVTEVIKG